MALLMNNLQILIQHGNKVYEAIVEEGVELESERKGSPAKLTFTILKDNIIEFEEGDAVRLSVDNKNIFYGFVFTKGRDKTKAIKVTAYDQLRYFTNKDTYTYTNKTASQVIKMLASDFLLNIGTIEDTEYIIASRCESNKTLFDIAQNALDLELENKKEMYVLYDDFGKICLKNLERMKLGLVINAETGENYDYTSSIDSDTYNKIKLTYDNEKTGKREVYISKDSSNINKWGILQYHDTIDEKTNGASKADSLLQLYNKKTRNLKVTNALGDTRVRGGSMIIVQLELDDVTVQNFMIVERVKHKFKNKEHLMDLTLRGGEFVA